MLKNTESWDVIPSRGICHQLKYQTWFCVNCVIVKWGVLDSRKWVGACKYSSESDSMSKQKSLWEQGCDYE